MRCPYVRSRTERIVTLKETVIDLRKESANPFEFLLDVTRRGGDIVRYEGPFGETYIVFL